MPRVSVVGKSDVPKDVQEIFAEIEGAFGMVPNLFKTYSHFPPLLRANWDKVKALMMQGNLSRKSKEAIAFLVSKDNSCSYCVAAHTAALKTIGVTDEEFALLREAGTNESEIVEALGVMELFTSFNKFLDSLKVEIDF